MAWVRLDIGFVRHPKVAEVGPLGLAMQVAALCYANEFLTDGFIPRAVVPSLANFEGLSADGQTVTWQLVASKLVEAGLWEERDNGYQIHDYLDYQPSRAQVLAERERKSEAGRKGGVSSARARSQTGPADTQAKAQASAQADDKRVLEQTASTCSSGSQAGAQAEFKPGTDPGTGSSTKSTSTVQLVGGTKSVPHVGGAENGSSPADEGEPQGDCTENAPSEPDQSDDEAAGDKTGPRSRDPEQEVMDCYNEAFAGLWARPLRLTPERRAKIKARLKSYSVEEICQAIKNIRASPYHCGENDGGKVYATPEFICKNDSTVDKWLKSVSIKRADTTESRFGGKAPPEVRALVNGSISAFFAKKEAIVGGSGSG